MQQSPINGSAPAGAVYVQTNASPNEVIAFRRASDGSLNRIGSMATGGEGEGSPHLTSQGSVALTRDGKYLLVTNAASDDLSVFSVAADDSIELRDRVHTGSTPRSVAEREGLVVVLNTGEPGLRSFRVDAESIAPVEGGNKALGSSDADPAQVGFSPDGSMVVITERGTDSIVTYVVRADGTFGDSREIASEGPTPYGFAFTSGGALVVTEAFRAEKGAAAASSYHRTRSKAVSSRYAPPQLATAAARSAGRSSHPTTGSLSRRTSPTVPSRAMRLRAAVRSRSRMRRPASQWRACRGCAT
jgi:6-phosphogluconolactonase